MTTKSEMTNEAVKVHQFLRSKASARSPTAVPQETLATEYGVSHARFHRILHRLVDQDYVRITGGGRTAKILFLTGGQPAGAPQPDHTELLRLLDRFFDGYQKVRGR